VARTGEMTTIASGATNIFRFKGPIEILSIYGLVTSTTEAGAANVKFQAKVGSLNAKDLCATVALSATVAGTSIRITGTAADAATLGTYGVQIGQVNPVSVICKENETGYLILNSDAAKTGKLRFVCVWRPLCRGSKVEPMIA